MLMLPEWERYESWEPSTTCEKWMTKILIVRFSFLFLSRLHCELLTIQQDWDIKILARAGFVYRMWHWEHGKLRWVSCSVEVCNSNLSILFIHHFSQVGVLQWHHGGAGRVDCEIGLRKWHKSIRFIGSSLGTPCRDRDGRNTEENELETDDLYCDNENLLEHKVSAHSTLWKLSLRESA